MSSGLRRFGLVCAGVVAAVLAVGAPAAAHGADAPDASDYRTEVTGLSPATPGVTVRPIEAGARLELRNDTGATITVLGYSGEPYLQVRPDGVYENVNSPATYLNETLAGDVLPPANADPAAAPEWRRTGGEPVARWHDQRAQWRGADPPPAARADPGRPHRVLDWTVPLHDDSGALVEVRGTVDWQPPPDAYLWWAGIGIVALLVGAAGLTPVASAAGDRALTALGALALVAGGAALVFSVLKQLDAGARGVGGLTLGLLGGTTWPVLTGLAALAAGAYALARRSAADFALALAGACVALFAGVANVEVLSRAVAPTVGDPQVARLAVAAVIAIGAGLTLAGVWRLRTGDIAAAQPAGDAVAAQPVGNTVAAQPVGDAAAGTDQPVARPGAKP
ncbi:hypothetical protein [Melissospora conviva]|uniref:hypothetical protein n=1 Tax=Melissospora conviva TaxID=3388432 RepID=UPI003B7F2078